MHRVELKVKIHLPEYVKGFPFLMHRVELKGFPERGDGVPPPGVFLMHRVELKETALERLVEVFETCS